MSEKQQKTRFWLSLTMGVLIVLAALTGCSSSNDKSSQSKSEFASMADTAALQNAEKAKAVDSNTSKTDAKSGTRSSASEPGGFTASDNTDGLNRKLIYKANLEMEVENYDKAQNEVKAMTASSGGYVLQFSENQSTGQRGGTFVIKVPASGFSSLLSKLDGIKNKKIIRNVQGQDVTEEYVDLTARLKARQAVEARLLSFMEKATKADELISFSTELGKVQTEIEQIQGRMRYLDQNVALSTIEVRVYQREGLTSARTLEKQSTGNRMLDALQGSFHFVIRSLEALLVVLSGALPVLILLAIIITPFVWYNLRRKKRSKGEEPFRFGKKKTESTDSPTDSDEGKRS